MSDTTRPDNVVGVTTRKAGDDIPKTNGISKTKEAETSAIDVTDDKKRSDDEKPLEDTKASLPRGSQCEIKRLRQRIDSEGDKKITEADTETEGEKTKPYDAFALTLKECYNAKNELEVTTLQINSPHILAALKQVVKYYPSEPLNFERKVTLNSPYMMLHHHFDELRALADAEPSGKDTDAAKHLQILLDFLEEDGRETRKLVDSNLIDFKGLWTIYKPGEFLFESEYGQDRLYRISRVGYNEGTMVGKFLEIRCTFTACDGEDIGTAAEAIHIKERQEFLGKNPAPVTSLSAYPLRFVGDSEDQDAVKQSLLERGKRYEQIKGITICQYEGLHLYLKAPPYDFYNECADYSGTWLPATTNGRVVVDAKTFAEEVMKKSESISCRRCDDEDEEKKDRREEMNAMRSNESDLILTPPHVFGFCLETKQWCKFFVDSLHPANWATNAVDSLVVPSHRKDVIRALVSSHQDHSNAIPYSAPFQSKGRTSRARNETLAKGRGLIILLHGEPGSGKTLTAEVMAEHAKRPLLNISTGELGSWEHRVAYELKRLLTYASIWKAIVLIDEADVFLESRQSGPTDMLEQNALVAVFLRQLEYFQGIAFLTSNRVEVFDAAVKSRIHLALKYTSPDEHVRRDLWRNKFNSLPADSLNMDFDDVIDAVCIADMNGREISNTVNTARTLAADQGVRLAKEHIVTVVKLWREFEGSLNTLKSDKGAVNGSAYTMVNGAT